MNRPDVLKIMAILKAAYPTYYKDMRRDDADGVVNLWAYQFKDFDADTVAAAVNALISVRTSNFPPVIGEVKDYIHKLTHPNEMTATEARGILTKALQNGLYGSEEEFKKLPPVIQSVLGSASVLREWAILDTVSLSVALSQFEKGFTSRTASTKEFEKLPQDIQKLSLGLAEKLRLTD